MTDTGHGLRVMTFNLQVDWDGAPHPWSGRRGPAVDAVRSERPHLLGTQEGLHAQVRDLAAGLGPEYVWTGQGREGGTRGEFMALFHDRRRLALLAHGDFWLSDTPEVPGSNTWGGGCPRMATWARFRDRATGGELCAVNTHFDHLSDHARLRSARLLAEWLTTRCADIPYLVTGDFNAPAGRSAAYDTLLAGADLLDTWDTAEARGPAYGTFHDHAPPVPDGDRIDWILAPRGSRIPSAGVDTVRGDGPRPSDHLPVHAVVDLAPLAHRPSPSPSPEVPAP
ncbi:endonuclease/exonuclease/phosphatase family protein [Streptomyces sp. ITFR-16]|uniref:endonuclease/exonuclease/phosphatase family protein n=1 Tax=Streptomyces sp. ITFR-16 TaxID=3075198 RepID=UPI00288AAF71|nr:endonuclease/exonuclease/phosphatase family protein [Streptomyces sp. ITFR-16]WNI22805.1 endonuclease/exonuclease/phosphatase family protein [Streptomyces sp. ITFR-16]